MKKTPQALAALAFVAAGSLVIGCGGDSGCPTETPRIDAIQSCTAQPGATVSVRLRLCPTCNLTGITCEVDLSGVASSGTIFLDPVAERCEGTSSCPPACSNNEAVCTFTAPSTSDTYTLQAFDPATNQVRTALLDVGTGPVACAF